MQIRSDTNVSVSKLITVIVDLGLEGGASSIHIEPDGDYTRVRFRIGSNLQTALMVPKNIHSQLMNRLKLMSQLFIDEVPMPQHGLGSFRVKGEEIPFSIATMPVGQSEKAVIHLPSVVGLSLEKLGYRKFNLDRIKRSLQKTSGLFSLAGPANSGKTSSGYSFLQERMLQGGTAATIEYPIEKFLPGVSQMSLRPEAGLNFQSAVNLLRKKPHRTVFTNQIEKPGFTDLVEMAMGGKFVIAGVDASSSYQALRQMADSSEAHMVATNLNTLVTQVLVPRLCSACRGTRKATAAESAWMHYGIKKSPQSAVPEELWRAKRTRNVGQARGCKKCAGTGYKGNVLLSEVLNTSTRLKKIIAMEYFSARDVAEELQHQGGISIAQDGALAVAQLETSPEALMDHLPVSAISIRL